MPSTNTQPARGMRDFLPAEVRKREYVIGVIKEVYERYGFEPLETPAVENIETLMGKYGEEGNQLIFKILKRGVHESTGEADLALRYDLTVPLARVVAEYKEKLPKFFKRYQIQPVWRADRPARGRFREFYQCDVDVLGSKSMIVEAELIAAASDALNRLGFTDFIIRLNHRKILTAILDASNIPSHLHAATLTALDKFEKVGPGGIADGLNATGISSESGHRLLTLLLDANVRANELLKRAKENAINQVNDTMSVEEVETIAYRMIAEANESILERIAGYTFPSKDAEKAIHEIKQVLRLLENVSPRPRVMFDLALARGLSYYTGAIIEINVPDLAGSLGGGGRYDNLVGMFLGKDVPACGFSLGLERIIVVMSERNMFPRHIERTSADVMVACWNEEAIPEGLRLADEIRKEGVRVLFYPEVRKFPKQMFYADKQNIRFRIIVGPDQIQSGNFEVRDKRTGGSLMLTRATIPTTLGKLIEEAEEARHGLAKILESKI